MHSHPVLQQQKPTKRVYNVVPSEEDVVEEIVETPIEEPTIEVEEIPEAIEVEVQPVFAVEHRGLEDITAVVVNYQTKTLIKHAVLSFRKIYPGVELVLVDNASTDGSKAWMRSRKGIHTRFVANRSNKGHGPALHREFQRATTKYVFTFDSDVRFLCNGLLEQMLEQIGDAYAIGWHRWVGHNGVSAEEGKNFNKDKFCPYIHPYAALYDREVYMSLPAFANNGAPAVYNMREAKKRGLEVRPFNLKPFVRHLIAGTRRMWDGHWYPGERKPTSKWKADKSYPI